MVKLSLRKVGRNEKQKTYKESSKRSYIDSKVFSFSNFALAYNTESSHVFEAELSLNTSMINEVFGVANDCAEPANVSTSDTRSISIYIENEMAHLSLTEDGNAFNGTLTGRVTPINTSDNLSGLRCRL